MGIAWERTLELFPRRVLLKKERHITDNAAKRNRTTTQFETHFLILQFSKLSRDW